MKKMYRLLLLVFFLPLGVLAQQKTINGKVTDSKNGQPLSGVTVTAGSAAIATGTDGSFTITVPANVKEIIFSYVGYSDIKEKIGNRNTINIQMAAASKDLGEVVVVGYGTQKKATLTGSVSTLKGAELITTKNENTLNMLTGKVAGLRMTQMTAEPGAYANSYDIRGFSGNGGGPPLIVIDGVPRSGFERMDPNEIESISVLKDASAAIYGVNGANGVILVTTKKGANKDGKFDISYSFNQAEQQFLGMPQGVGPVDYMMLTNEAVRRNFDNNFAGNAPPTYSYDNIMAWVNGKNVGANWINAAFNTTSPQVSHNVNISGGSDKVSTFTSLGYMKQDGLLKSNALDYARWNLRSNINMKINDRLRAQVLLSGYSDEKNQPYQDLWTIFKYAWNQIPINQIYANGNPNYLNVMPDNVNPVAVIDPSKVGYKQFNETNLQAQGILDYTIPGIKGLTARGMYSYGYVLDNNTSNSKLYNLYAYSAADSTYTASPVTATAQPPALNRSFGNSSSTLGQISLNYAHTFNGVHNVTALLLYEESHFTSDNFYAQQNMPDLPVNYLFDGLGGTGVQGNTNANGVNEVATKGIVGRLDYDYKGKYLAEFSVRRDASNYFAPGHQWGTFPAYAVGWRASEEPFFKNNISRDVISNFKIRASYGTLGTSNAQANFKYLSGYTYPTTDPADQRLLGYMINGQYVNGTATTGLANEDITWYTAHTTNIGIDFTVFKNKIDGTIDVYRRDLDGLLNYATVQLPGTLGAQLPLQNLDSRRTQGIELSLSYKSRIGRDFGILLAGNVSYERDRALHVTEGPQGNQYLQWRNGQTDRNSNILWGTDYGGQYTNYGQIYNSTVNSGNGNNSVLPGDYYMQDWNGDGVIDGNDYHPIAIEDLPLINFGFNIGLTYKGFDATALFAGAAGVWTEYGEQLGQPLMYGRSALSKFLDSWHTADPYANEYDPNTQWIAGKYPSMGYDYGQIANSTKGIVNASYVRLKTLEVGYTLPHRFLQKIGVKNCRLYLNGYNLLTITGLDDGVDPEHPGSFPGASFNNALGGYQYPLNKTFNIGGNITF